MSQANDHPSLRDTATLVEITELLAPWAIKFGVLPVTLKTLRNLAGPVQRRASEFPDPVPLPGPGADRYHVSEVLTWYFDRLDRQLTGGRARVQRT